METKMKSLDLEKLNSQIETFVHERDWDQFHSIKNLTMALSVESSELVEIYQWLNEAQSASAHQDPKLRSKIEDEVADIFVYLMRILSKTGIDLEQAVTTKLQKNAEKYPVELARGNAKKYDQF